MARLSVFALGASLLIPSIPATGHAVGNTGILHLIEDDDSEVDCATAAELPLPENGEVESYSDDRAIAPFRIETSGSAYYFVKLVDLYTDEDVLTVFVHGGRSVEIEVPLGTYTVKYAAGQSWYGDECYFGEETSYAQADSTFDFRRNGSTVTGYTITLYAVPGGNLSTSRIGKDKF